MDWGEKLKQLQALSSESECVEFKSASKNFDSRKLGKYLSALANEANLAHQKEAWIIFGVRDSDHAVTGTGYRQDPTDLQSIKAEIAKHMTDGFTFMDVVEVFDAADKRTVLFRIPPAPRGIPIAYEGHYYARNSEELTALSIEKQDRIRSQGDRYDWSREIVHAASIADLSAPAIEKARSLYKQKNPSLAEEIASWTNEVFLNKAKLTIGNKITNATIILLGKPEATSFLTPAQAKISWILKAKDGLEKDYEHFSPPFVLAVDDLYHKVRNLKYRYISSHTLFPDEVSQYEPFIIREALNNCIVHQEYPLGGIIRVVENEDDSLIFSNLGSFMPGSVESVIEADSPYEYYRNRFLAEAMVNLGMIDTIGSGIKRMFVMQQKKFFPLPDYTIQPQQVAVRIYGKVLDIEYAQRLAQIPDLDLRTMMLLDKVQRGKSITDDAIKELRARRLIEGRRPHIRISSKVASQTHSTADYLRRRGVDDDYCKKMIVDYLELNGVASSKDFRELLDDKLASSLTSAQKANKMRNILQSMRSKQVVAPIRGKKWILGDRKLDEL